MIVTTQHPWRSIGVFLAMVLIIAGSAPASAEVAAAEWVEIAEVAAPDSLAGDMFGSSVAVSGSTGVVGAPLAEGFADSAGAVYVMSFRDSRWSISAKLRASDGNEGDGFGRSVALSGSTAVVGARGHDGAGRSSGSAYVFARTRAGWSEISRLTASDAAEGDGFGAYVAISGTTAVVGAPGDDPAGAAYVFTKTASGWEESAKLTPSDATFSAQFGTVSISGDTILVGAITDNIAGSVYVFTRTPAGWAESAKITAPGPSESGAFGWAVSLSGNTAVIGEPFADDYTGNAYVFRRTSSGWVESAKLIAPDGGDGSLFGVSVGISGPTVVVGAESDDTYDFSGVAYVFERTRAGWAESIELVASDGVSEDIFGESVAVSGDRILVGAPYAEGAGTGGGAVYLFDRAQ